MTRGAYEISILSKSNHPGASSTDLLDHIKPIARNNVDHIIYHGICNDLDKPEIDSIKNLDQMVKYLKRTSPLTKLSVSLLIPRNDQKGMNSKVTDMNEKIKKYCSDNNISIVSHSNVRMQHLGKKGVHLGEEGLRIFAGNFSKYVRKLH